MWFLWMRVFQNMCSKNLKMKHYFVQVKETQCLSANKSVLQVQTLKNLWRIGNKRLNFIHFKVLLETNLTDIRITLWNIGWLNYVCHLMAIYTKTKKFLVVVYFSILCKFTDFNLIKLTSLFSKSQEQTLSIIVTPVKQKTINRNFERNFVPMLTRLYLYIIVTGSEWTNVQAEFV